MGPERQGDEILLLTLDCSSTKAVDRWYKWDHTVCICYTKIWKYILRLNKKIYLDKSRTAYYIEVCIFSTDHFNNIIRKIYLEHDFWGLYGLLAHDDHVAVRQADALLRKSVFYNLLYTIKIHVLLKNYDLYISGVRDLCTSKKVSSLLFTILFAIFLYKNPDSHVFSNFCTEYSLFHFTV